MNDVNKYDVILVGTNTYHTMGNGFQKKIRYKYPETFKLNLTTKYGDHSKVGTRITYAGPPKISLCFITKGYNFRPDLNPDYLDYDGLEKCLKTANIEFAGLNVATTILGCSKFDGNGDRDRVIDILKNNSDKINLYIYDYKQLSRNVEKAIKYLSIVNNENYDTKMKAEMFKNIPEEETPMENIEKRIRRMKKEIKDSLNN